MWFHYYHCSHHHQECLPQARSSAKCIVRIMSCNLHTLVNEGAAKPRAPEHKGVRSLPCVGAHWLESWLRELLERATFALEDFLPLQSASFWCFLGFMWKILDVHQAFKMIFFQGMEFQTSQFPWTHFLEGRSGINRRDSGHSLPNSPRNHSFSVEAAVPMTRIAVRVCLFYDGIIGLRIFLCVLCQKPVLWNT